LTDALTGTANCTNTKGVTPRGHTFLLSNAVPNAGLVPPGRYCRRSTCRLTCQACRPGIRHLRIRMRG